MECIDPGAGVYRGDDIAVPNDASLFRCPACERDHGKGRNTILFRGVLRSGTVIEVLCRRCKALVKFAAEQKKAEQRKMELTPA
jgi:hypothetical protein